MKNLALTLLTCCLATSAIAGTNTINIPGSHLSGQYCCKTSGGLFGPDIKFYTHNVNVDGYPGQFTLSKSDVNGKCFSFSKNNPQPATIDYKVVSHSGGSVDCSEQ